MSAPPKDLDAKLRTAYRSAAFGSFAVSLLARFELRNAVASSDAERQRLRAEYKAKLGIDALEVLGVKWSVDGPRSAPGRPRLVVANHRSAIDIAVLLTQFDATMLSRGDLADWPVLGRLARQGGTIFVDRRDAGSGARALREIGAALDRGETVCVFPEGTTLAGDEVRPFHAGAFLVARQHRAEVVPAGFAYTQGSEWTEPTFGGHLANVAARPTTRVHLVIGEGRPVEGRADKIAKAMRDEVQALVHVARRRLDGT